MAVYKKGMNADAVSASGDKLVGYKGELDGIQSGQVELSIVDDDGLPVKKGKSWAARLNPHVIRGRVWFQGHPGSRP